MPRQQSSSSSSSESDSSSSQANPNFVPVTVERLSRNVTQEHVKQIFSHFGTVGSIFMKYGPQLSSYATVHFFSRHEAEIAISYMNKGYIDGSQIIVQLQLPKNRSNSPNQKRRDYKQRKRYDRQRYDRRNKKNQKKYRSRRTRKQRSSSSSGVSSSRVSSDSNST